MRPLANTKRFGKAVFIGGMVIYLAILAARFGMFVRGNEIAGSMLSFYLLLPLLLSISLFGLFWMVFFVGTITGTPLISFTHALLEAKRNWKVVVGVVLLMAAAINLIVEFALRF